jgi:uncharacterized protein involved in exopolysaccharide biosynthesis
MALERTENTWSDYMGVLRRRWRISGAVAMLVAFGIIYTAYALPAVYESSATILISTQRLPRDFVQTTIDSYAEQLLQTILANVLSSTKVAEMIDRFDLYPEERGSLTDEDLILLFKDSTSMSPQNVETVNARTGREAIITFGFTIAFQDSDPVKARDVAHELSNLFVSHNSEMRAEAAARASLFLDTEAAALEESLKTIAKRIATFKERNVNNLPEDQDVNTRTWERLGDELIRVETALRETRELKALLESELVDIPRYRPVMDQSGEAIIGGTDQLAAAQQELIRLRGRYSEDHPSVVNLRREIAALSSAPANRSSMAEQLQARLQIRRQELSAAREAYSDSHPDVLMLEKTVTSLEQQLEDLETEIALSGGNTTQPNNPVYVQTRTRIDSAAEELADLNRRRNDLRARIDNLEALRLVAPQVEREYTALEQEQGVLLTQYRGLRNMEGEAALGEALETGEQGERLVIIEEAREPSSPISPNRVSLTFLGIVLAIALGLGTASLTEAMDTTVRGRNDLHQLLDAPPMGIIPYVNTRSDTIRRMGINIAMSAAALGAIGFIITAAVS